MKIQKNGDNLELIITRSEFKKAFESEENFSDFRQEIIKIIGTFHMLEKELEQ